MNSYEETINSIIRYGIEMEKELIDTKDSVGRILAEDINYIENSKKHKVKDSFKEISQYYREKCKEQGEYTKITAKHIGILSLVNKNKIMVLKKPIVGIISLSQNLEDVKSNIYFLFSRLKEVGCIPLVLNDFLDTEEKVIKGMKTLNKKCDFIISIGDLSSRDELLKTYFNYEEIIKDVCINSKLGIKCFNKDGKLLFNIPVSLKECIITFEIFIRKYIAFILNCKQIDLIKTTGFLKKSIHRSDERDFKLMYLLKETINLIYDYEDINEKESIAFSNAIIDIPENKELKKGEKLEVYLI
ncbi:MAG: hypothetical protein ACRC2K_09860 [Clostridium sp.]